MNITIPGFLEGLAESSPYTLVAVVGLLPGFEPRYAILLGAYLGLPTLTVLLIAVLEVALLSTLLSTLIEVLDRVLAGAKTLGGYYRRYRSNVVRRARGHIERWGGLGLVIFVAIPLPATGIYTGALAGALLGIHGRRLAAYLALGGLVSVAITLTLSGLVW
ncbi:MAG: small multi-drug export protein [Desulfurococcales archaeon]|nr:small multi-drug export protein [Desulfurococcales archaeon]